MFCTALVYSVEGSGTLASRGGEGEFHVLALSSVSRRGEQDLCGVCGRGVRAAAVGALPAPAWFVVWNNTAVCIATSGVRTPL